MRSRTRTLFLAVAIAVATVGVGVALAVGRSGIHPHDRASHSGESRDTVAGSAGSLTVGGAGASRPLPGGFVGVSFEFRGLEQYLGTNPQALDQPFLQLIHDLSPGHSPVVRIGGDSTDWTWWPVHGMARPGGARYALGPQWASVAHALATSLRSRLILGVNFEADSRRVASAMASRLLGAVGARQIAAFELGNEPELYASFNWYRTRAGVGVRGRAADYDFSTYLADYAHVAAMLPRVPLAGPSSGSPTYLDYLGRFLSSVRRVALVTVHAYPLRHCSPADHPTDAQLLAPASSSGLATQVGAYVAVAHAHDLPLRVDEINSVSCGGYAPVTETFGAALWALETLEALDRVGVDGVNFHMVPNTTQHLIAATDAHGHWTATVLPEYYGALAFAQAAPAGSRLASISGTLAPGLTAFATRGPGPAVHVVLINTGSGLAAARLAGLPSTVRLSRLLAPSLGATGSVTLGGQSIDSNTGSLTGASTAHAITAATGVYVVSVPRYSAAILSSP
jgi:hypothetical protein